VTVEIRPEPSDEERAAILAAVQALLGSGDGRAVGGSGWWQAGLREAIGEEDVVEELPG
jgi:hypothetical protein